MSHENMFASINSRCLPQRFRCEVLCTEHRRICNDQSDCLICDHYSPISTSFLFSCRHRLQSARLIDIIRG